MKLLLVLGSNHSYDLIVQYIKPLGFELIRYHHVVKAMDNIDEINPMGIIVSARDFPRHWKILVQFVRTERGKESCPIIILKGGNFPLEETSKAFFLGVSGLVDEDMNDSTEIDRLQKILSRYIPVEEKRKFDRTYVEPWHRVGLLISSPIDKMIIPGEVKTISLSGISYSPAGSSMMKDIALNAILDECSLRVGNDILSPVCKLVRTGRIVSFEFVSFPPGEQKILEDFLSVLPLRKLTMKA
ncbi:MAG: PilZ domain-containing protein [Treponema sp.]|jgi:hypothetical protein|nr:PilZ domain-containing protein [Treponema sp.]